MKKVLDKIKPTKQETKEIKELTENIFKKVKINNCKLELGGSIAKGTWLHNDHDIDVYAVFDFQEYKNKNISKILEKTLKKHYKITTLKGSRNYFQIKKEKYIVEIIPILKINKASEALNITDISPLHTRYVKKFKDKNQILLTKAFFKAQKVYGAESHIKGFSGYVTEILTIHYKTFNNLLKNIAKWKTKTLIGDEQLIKNLNKSKRQSPLILIDPTDKTRNASAALGKEKYKIIIKKARQYLKNPSEAFFKQEPFMIPKTNQTTIQIEITPLKGKKDVVGSKILYCYNYIKKKLVVNDFKIIKSNWNWKDKALLYYIIDKKPLDKYKKHYGPPKEIKRAIKAFKTKWKNKKIYTEGNKIYIKVLREHTISEKYIQHLIKKDKNIKKKVKEIKVIK